MGARDAIERFTFPPELTEGVRGKRVLITGAGRHGGMGEAFALAAGLNGAAAVGVHYHSSAGEAHETVDLINRAGGHAFPVQADVTNTSDCWSIRSYVIAKMGGLPPNLLICNSGLAESGYMLGRPLKEIDGETPSMRRSRARQAFVDNLRESTDVIHTKMDGFLYMTHLWAGEALHVKEPLQVVYISSRQAVDPGPGVPGYVLANFGVLSLPRIVRTNLGKHADLVTAYSVAYPFVRTGMTEAYGDDARVYGRWQPRMLETHEAALALVQLMARPARELDDHVFQLDVTAAPEGTDGAIRATWAEIELRPVHSPLAWSAAGPLVFSSRS